MLIDLTKKPLIVYPEDCHDSVVVRSIGNGEVSGLVLKPGSKESRRASLTPGAKYPRGRSNLYETRIPLPGAHSVEANDADGASLWRRHGAMTTRPLRPGEKPPAKIVVLADPYEVASAYQDALTGFSGTWRTGIRVEHVPKLKKAPWVVSIVDMTTLAALASVAVSGLDPNPEIIDPLPLAKAIQRTLAPSNAWTRLLEDDNSE